MKLARLRPRPRRRQLRRARTVVAAAAPVVVVRDLRSLEAEGSPPVLRVWSVDCLHPLLQL
jgi:hypothetical protein